MGLMSISEAAGRLGVSPQRVHQLLESGALVGQRPGHEWLIDEADLPRSRRQVGGRPLSPSSAWALLVYAHDPARARALLSAPDRSRARQRLRELARLRHEMLHCPAGDDPADLEDPIGLQSPSSAGNEVEVLSGQLSLQLRNRADRRIFIAAGLDLEDLRVDARVRAAGVSLPIAEIFASDMVEAYVDQQDLDDLVNDYLLDPSRPGRSNVVLHVIPHEVRELAAAVPVDFWLLVAADLNEHAGAREFLRALRLLDGLDDLDRDGQLARYSHHHE